MKVSGSLAPLAVCAVRDAVRYHERLLQSETLRNRADYEAYAVDLSVFLDELTHRYEKLEASFGLALDDFFDSDPPVMAYAGKHAIPESRRSLEISDPYAMFMVSSARDAILYRERLLHQAKSPEELRGQQEYLNQLENLLASVKEEYRKIESKLGVPLEKLLHLH